MCIYIKFLLYNPLLTIALNKNFIVFWIFKSLIILVRVLKRKEWGNNYCFPVTASHCNRPWESCSNSMLSPCGNRSGLKNMDQDNFLKDQRATGGYTSIKDMLFQARESQFKSCKKRQSCINVKHASVSGWADFTIPSNAS